MNPMGRPEATEADGFFEGKLAGHVARVLSEAGAGVGITHPTPGRPNVTGFFDFGAAETVLFEAHLDTVPADGMTVPAFAGETRDGRLCGRGACDVKGPMAAMLAAIRRAASGSPRFNVLFAAVCDEEYQFQGVRHLLRNLPPERLEGIAFAVVAEPTLLSPVVAHKGVMRWRAEARGAACHSSTPDRGRNAIYAMSDGVAALRGLADALALRPGHPHLGSGTLSVGTIRGGAAVNIVPDSCVIEVDRRLLPGEEADEATRELRGVLEPLGITVSQPYMQAPGFEAAPGSAAVEAVTRAAESVGIVPAPRFVNYCTDASFYPGFGIPAVVFGPGSIDQAHQADEWIAIDQLEAGAEAYLRILV